MGGADRHARGARAAPEQQHRLLCPSVQQWEGVLRVRMRTRLCFVGARARHVCMQGRLRKLRGGAEDAHDAVEIMKEGMRDVLKPGGTLRGGGGKLKTGLSCLVIEK